MKWQPIETAPIGRAVIVWDDGDVIIAARTKERWPVVGGDDEIVFEDGYGGAWTPTHWQPLPDPPETP